MRTSVTELPDSRVRLEVGIDPDAVEKRLERTARQLGREMRVPGFRRGKVPPALVVQRMGRDTVLEQALRDSLPEWYERALLEAGITPVGDRGLDVGRAEVEVPADAITAELDRLREGFASVSPVDRPAATGDLVVIDFE